MVCAFIIMISRRQLFLNYIAQTSEEPFLLDIEKAEGVTLFAANGKKYLDLISGVSVNNLGHRHPAVVKAIKDQVDKYLHLMVYGEYIQSPQVRFAALLTKQLPESLNNVYLVNSGSEAIEGALKLAKRYTGRPKIIAFNNAYHGSTHGALSVMGNETFKNSFRPLVPGVHFLTFNKTEELEQIDKETACVLIEPIQGEGGINLPKGDFLTRIRQKCDQTGSLLIFDEVQTGFGRTGSLFAFQTYGVIPDIIVFAKGMGGGMPIGAFVASKTIMSAFKTNPILGHITTFGGHPVSAAAALASLETLLQGDILEGIPEKEALFRKRLKHRQIKEIRGKGLFLAVDLEDPRKILQLVREALEGGVVVDWFLFRPGAFRVAPPLVITENEIKQACSILLRALDTL